MSLQEDLSTIYFTSEEYSCSLSSSRTPSGTEPQTYVLLLNCSLCNHWSNQPLNIYQKHTVQIEFFLCHLKTAYVKLSQTETRRLTHCVQYLQEAADIYSAF